MGINAWLKHKVGILQWREGQGSPQGGKREVIGFVGDTWL